MSPPEEASRDIQTDYAGPEDVMTYENDGVWNFESDLVGIKAYFDSLPFVSQLPDIFEDFFKELYTLMADGRIAKGCFPAKIVLATRRQDIPAKSIPRPPDASKAFEFVPSQNLPIPVSSL
ncbi:hypothetical protein F5883DRAFT_69972 [Diaporthe sp. PMI_573]|nr:hypothetical protein F5883DRAFT_69972 [Diaporthaceae sp. PMI_573]